ncbi:hypothetical protein QTO30_06040 [Yoonia sp. GPGPB17]|uniref:hypothetical protein n=1 Tax=Yoonia sp. GPGPB17 TaxID=3026147 RepID=UPI0030C3ACE6
MTEGELYDPKGLIKDAFAIEGIAPPECRSIFLDWALGVPPGRDVRQDVRHLIAHYAPLAPANHPMLDTLRAALPDATPPRRRGGRSGRQ